MFLNRSNLKVRFARVELLALHAALVAPERWAEGLPPSAPVGERPGRAVLAFLRASSGLPGCPGLAGCGGAPSDLRLSYLRLWLRYEAAQQLGGLLANELLLTRRPVAALLQGYSMPAVLQVSLYTYLNIWLARIFIDTLCP
jgi:hypothetical protein